MAHSTASPLQTGGSSTPDGAPVLVLLDAAGDSIGGDTRLLGLTLARRAALAARRAGYAQTIVLGADAEALPSSGPRRLVFAPAQAVAEVAWLEAAARVAIPAGGWAGLPGRVAVVGSPVADSAIADLGQFSQLERQLTERLGPPARGPEGADPLVLRDRGDLPLARRRLLRALVKDSDGFMAKHVERPISIALSRWLAETPVTPNQITVISGAIGVAAAPFFLSLSPLWQTIGALLFLAHSIIDGCDGEIARLKFQESRWGGVLDFWADNLVHLAVFSCMAAGWAYAEGSPWPLALGVTAIIGAGGSAGFVHWRLLRDKPGEGPLFTGVSASKREALARFLDGAGRRDFIYLVLALALFGKSSWFTVLAGIGAPVYLVLLLVLALREGLRPSAASAAKATVTPPAALET
jgi:phosphatidylglycerophosphate synthase